MNLVTAHNVEVRNSPVHGWGVFAKENIPEGTIVEESPLTHTTIHCENDRHRFLNDYFWSDKNNNYVLSLGLGSVFNRSDTPNVSFEAFMEDNFQRYITSNDVSKDEELFVDYSKRILRS